MYWVSAWRWGARRRRRRTKRGLGVGG